ncbi:DUF1801 family [Durusdinium trenchii]
MKRPSAAVQVRRGVLRAEHAPSAPRKATGELSVVPKDAFYASTRGAWRGWLKKNFASRSYIWLVFPKKASKLPSVRYNDAVEEALCFGWIDSTYRPLSETLGMQRFTPRRKIGENYSQPNVERLRWVDAKGLIEPTVRPQISHVLRSKFEWPKDILAAIEREPEAARSWKRFSASYRRIRVAWVEQKRKSDPAEFKKRLRNLVQKTKQGRQFGSDIDKYY